MNSLDEEGVKTIGEAKEILPSQDIQKRMKDIFNNVLGIHNIYDTGMEEEPDHTPWLTAGPPVGMMLYYGTKIMAGDPSGYQIFRKAVEVDHEDTVSTAQREVLYELPETVDELILQLKNGTVDPDDLAHILREIGGIHECDMCGEEILSSEDAHDALGNHYKHHKAELLPLLRELEDSFPMDTVDENMSVLCHHCAHLLTSDNT